MLFWLRQTGYDGWFSMDQYPYREDAAGAIGESIQWLRGYDALVKTSEDEIRNLVREGDAVAVSRFLRRLILGADVPTA